jgi:two-component system chemotaxis response regulator CheB
MINVIIIDDSALVRKVISQEISKDSEITVVATAPDPIIGRDKILKHNPDVILLDVEMPRMDGITFLKKLMKHFPIPVIIVSSLAQHGSEVAVKALEYGAVDVVPKPGGSYSVKDLGDTLIEKIKAAAKVDMKKAAILSSLNEKIIKDVEKPKRAMIKTTEKIIAIGASTGGTQALRYLISKLPSDMPPIVIVQHMPQNFTKSFADSLNNISKLEVKEAENKDSLYSGRVLIAPGNKHMVLRRSGAKYYVEVKDGEQVYHQRPSVEVLFYSVAQYAGKNSIGVMLTGMGKDGARGMLEMKKNGAYTIAQDEKTSVVFGMPKEAIDIGAVDKILPLDNMPDFLSKFI